MNSLFRPSRIAWKLIAALIVFSSLVTLITSTIQLFSEYGRDIDAIESRFLQVERSYLDSISENVWEADSERLGLLVSGIIEFPDFRSAIVREKNGDVLANAGEEEQTQVIRRVYPLHYRFRGDDLKIGELEVVATLTGVYDRIFERIGLILASNAIKTFLVAMFLFFVIHWVLTRHLAAMVGFAHKMNFELPSEAINLERGFLGGRRDEVDDLADSLNDMQIRLKNSFQEKQESEERLRSIVDSTSAALSLKTTDGYFLLVNDIFASWFGVEPSEIIGKKADDFLLADDLQGVADSDKTVIAGQISVREESRIFPDGNLRFVIIQKAPVISESGEVTGIATVITDISDRKKAEGRFRGAIESMQEGFILFDADDRLVSINDVFRRINPKAQEFLEQGVTFEEMVRANVERSWMIEAQGREEEFVRERIEQHRNPGSAIIRQYNDGKYYQILESRTPEDGVAVTFVDITDLKNAENAALKSQARLSEIFDIAPEAVITVGEDMNIQLFNQGAERIFGYAAEEALGQSLEILMPERFHVGHHKYVEEFDHSGDIYRLMNRRQEIIGLHKDGTEFPASASVSKLEVGGEKIFTVMLHDISDRKQAEEDLRLALVDAEQANQAKSQFLATMSHEFRTPLNAILGFSDILTHQYFGPPGEGKYREYAKDIHSSGEHLLELVNDLLDISTIEAGKQSLNKELLVAHEMVAESFNAIGQKAQEKGIKLITEVSKNLPPLYADRRAARQILLNLLTNAVKFTPDGGKITVSAKASKQNATFKIIDTGQGIAPERLANLTDPFTRGEQDPHKSVEGWGLGLAITKSLVDLHDGQMDIESTFGKGTTITVTLPNAV